MNSVLIRIIYPVMFLIDPCLEYTEINDTTRSIFSNETVRLSDMKLMNNAWHRFNGGVHSQMIVSHPVDILKCGTIRPGWLASKHPRSKFIAKK